MNCTFVWLVSVKAIYHFFLYVALCCTAKSSIDEPDFEGRTPLMLAARNGHTGVIEALVKAGCDLHVRDRFSNTAMSLAEEHGHVFVVSYLQQVIRFRAKLVFLIGLQERFSLPCHRTSVIPTISTDTPLYCSFLRQYLYDQNVISLIFEFI